MGSEARDNGVPIPDASASQNADAKAKGKGVAKEETAQDIPEPADSDSVMSRIGQSAAALSRSVFQGPPTASDLENVASAGKAEPPTSASRSDHLAESSAAARASTSAGAFRPGAVDRHAATEEAAFSDFLDSTDLFIPKEPIGLERAWQTAGAEAPNPTSCGSSRGAAPSSVAEQQDRDGVEVVRLLSQVDDEMPAYDPQTRLTDTELNNLRHALFESGTSAQVSASSWYNMLNFVPGFLSGQEGSHGGVGAAGNSFIHLGVTDTAEAGQIWLEDWNRVLTGYADEVWGDLGDLVQEARAEVKKMQDNQPGQRTGTTALRQLQSTLQRVRARL